MFRTPANDVHVHIYSAGCQEIQRNYATAKTEAVESIIAAASQSSDETSK